MVFRFILSAVILLWSRTFLVPNFIEIGELRFFWPFLASLARNFLKFLLPFQVASYHWLKNESDPDTRSHGQALQSDNDYLLICYLCLIDQKRMKISFWMRLLNLRFQDSNILFIFHKITSLTKYCVHLILLFCVMCQDFDIFLAEC